MAAAPHVLGVLCTCLIGAWLGSTDVHASPRSDERLAEAETLADSARYGEAAAAARELMPWMSRRGPQKPGEFTIAALFIRASLGAARPVDAALESLVARMNRQTARRPDHNPLATTLALESLARVTAARSRMAEALRDARQAVRIWDRGIIQSPTAEFRARALLGKLELDAGRSASAESVLSRAIEVSRLKVPVPRMEAAAAWADLGFARLDLHDRERSNSAFGTAIGILETTGRRDSLEVARWLIGRGDSYEDLGRPRDAITDYQRACALWRRARGRNDPGAAKALNRLGRLLGNLGELGAARDSLEEAIRLYQLDEAAWRREAAYARLNLGNVLYRSGDCRGASRLFNQSYGTLMRPEIADTAKAANCLNNLGASRLENRHFAAAAAYLNRGLTLLTHTSEPDTNYIANTLMNLGLTYRQLHKLDSARVFLDESRRLRMTTLVPDPLQIAALHHNLGLVAADAEDFELARAHMDSARVIYQALVAPEHFNLLPTTEKICEMDLALGNTHEAFSGALLNDDQFLFFFRSLAPLLSPEEVLTLAAARPPALDVVLSVAMGTRDSAMVTAAWSELIHSRAAIFDAARDRTQSAVSDSLALRAEQALDQANAAHGQLLFSRPGGMSDSAYADTLRVSNQELRRAQRDLAARNPRYRGALEMQSAGWKEVRGAIPRNTALIAYVKFGLLDPEGVLHRRPARARTIAPGDTLPNAIDPTPWYGAFVWRPGMGAPRLVNLGAADGIDSLIVRWYSEAFGETPSAGPALTAAERRCEAAGSALRRRLWDPIAALTAGVSALWVVEDGMLSLVSLGALPGRNGGYLVEHRPPIDVLTCERDLTRPFSPDSLAHGLAAFGGVDYSAEDSTAVRKIAGRTIDTGDQFRGGLPGCLSVQQRNFPALEHTGAEARAIGTLWHDHPASPRSRAFDVVEGREASEDVFRWLAPRREVLHIATHGFYLSPGCVPAGGSDVTSDEAACAQLPDDPLLYCGLAFAGANGHHDATGSDGILTGQEIASLDLRGVRLAVLSACGTALGPIESGEGMFGLRRAFQLAGCRSVVTTLSPVRDEATDRMMTHFYGAYLTGLSPSQSLRRASIEFLQENRRTGRSTHPGTWGAFVASGGPR